MVLDNLWMDVPDFARNINIAVAKRTGWLAWVDLGIRSGKC